MPPLNIVCSLAKLDSNIVPYISKFLPGKILPKFAPMYCAKNLPDLISPHEHSSSEISQLNQHMEANRSATGTKTNVASIPGGSGGPQW